MRILNNNEKESITTAYMCMMDFREKANAHYLNPVTGLDKDLFLACTRCSIKKSILTDVASRTPEEIRDFAQNACADLQKSKEDITKSLQAQIRKIQEEINELEGR